MNRTRFQQRDGTLVVCVLVCLLVASTMVVATTQSALQARRGVRKQHQLRQTELLLDAGILRAAQAVKGSADYRGELWRPGKSIASFDNALVEIRIEQDPDSQGSLTVEVVASLGAKGDSDPTPLASRTQRSHRFNIPPSDSFIHSNSSNAE